MRSTSPGRGPYAKTIQGVKNGLILGQLGDGKMAFELFVARNGVFAGLFLVLIFTGAGVGSDQS